MEVKFLTIYLIILRYSRTRKGRINAYFFSFIIFHNNNLVALHHPKVTNRFFKNYYELMGLNLFYEFQHIAVNFLIDAYLSSGDSFGLLNHLDIPIFYNVLAI